MSSTFAGFSEEDLQRIKSSDSDSNSVPPIDTSNVKKINKIGAKPKRAGNQYKLPILQKQDSDENMANLFDKCKLSTKTPTSPRSDTENNNDSLLEDGSQNELKDGSASEDSIDTIVDREESKNNNTALGDSRKHSITSEEHRKNSMREESRKNSTTTLENRKNSTNMTPDIVRCVDNYTEDDLAAHRAKLAELQLKQKLMEEQNKKRKEMLAKALADRTKQTAEEVQRLEKIKKELAVLDGQFSQDVAVLRKKIDLACLSYADAEKHYLKVEKEFLQAKIQLQKEKEKKELLTEHLCALITHNETRKAHKLENLMLELASDKKMELNEFTVADDDVDKAVIVDGVDQNTGKIVEFSES